ncbi:hypothetical protein D051_4793 [Vibrio parahaemolyticus VPCR-2010]|nr:hypothetical protein D051_4793 [Vibrio parahaemolyticus VPCR-2010]
MNNKKAAESSGFFVFEGRVQVSLYSTRSNKIMGVLKLQALCIGMPNNKKAP